MKYILTGLVLLISMSLSAQDDTKDSTGTAEIIYVKKADTDKGKDKEKEGIGDVFVRLGKGFLERLKYRFNLEAVEEKVDRAQRKLKNEEDKPSDN